jgi:hypothetical protein
MAGRQRLSCAKVDLPLAEKGVEFELDGVNSSPVPEGLVAISPAKRIPVLRDRSVGTEGVAGTILDSSASFAAHRRREPAVSSERLPVLYCAGTLHRQP